jgi:hypothetical protein
MFEIKIQILKITDIHQPGFVECLLIDAWGKHHKIIEKIPVVSYDDIWLDSEFPTGGFIACKIIKEWIDTNERRLITVSTEDLDDVETTNGVKEFDLLPHQLLNFT